MKGDKEEFWNGLGWALIWCSVGVLILGMGGCSYLLYHGDKENSSLVSIHIHLK